MDPGATKVPKARLTASSGIVAKPIGSEFGDVWQVISYEFTLVRGNGSPIVKVGSGNTFTADMKEVLARLRTGDQLYIENIKAKLANGEGMPRSLSPIAVKVQ